ncbi:pole remodelling regulatory diguanylate cyclase [Vibrio sp. RC586]|uniref:response regulator n=1 Tax=Vibrio sp. RC586 TaxID=675815 RepID=UPI0001BB7C4C|nr:two-component system response regulator [Vibrio sp. RC586]EEY99693.1 pole remodelling regulatory diguanylate cyclase [Vibrio sp. RC586]
MSELETILIVDDNPENRALLAGLLKPHYRLLVAVSGAQALAICHKQKPDLVLLDIMMPEMDGYEVCQRMRADPELQDIPVIFLTAKSQIEDEQHGFDVGAVDYILKPISPPILLARTRTHLRLQHTMKLLAEQNETLEQKVKERTQDLEALQDATIIAMASLAETRDNETGNHIRRTQRYIKVLAEQLRLDGQYADQLTPESILALYKSSPLHDIGKVGIPDHVLLKPGKLTEEEFEIMKSHTVLGRDVIDAVEECIHFECDFLTFAKEIAYSHQEKWDGSGYPEGLKGEEIPLSARLMALVDVYDALISRRVYKPPFSHEKAVTIIEEGRGHHFDPAIVAAFLKIERQFRQIAQELSDEDILETTGT